MERRKAARFGVSLALLRHVQWLLVLVSYLLFRRGFAHIRTTFDMDTRVNTVPVLNAVALVYASVALVFGVYASPSLPLVKRRDLEAVSLAMDFAVAIVLLVNMTLLNSTRLDCQGLLEEKFFAGGPQGTSLTRHASVGSSGDRAVKIDDIDRQCGASISVYCISFITLFSYISSLLITATRAREYRRLLSSRCEKKVDVDVAADHVTTTVGGIRQLPSPGSSFFFWSPTVEELSSLPHELRDSALPVSHRPHSAQGGCILDTSAAETPSSASDRLRASPDPPPSYSSSRPISLGSYKGD